VTDYKLGPEWIPWICNFWQT